MKFQIDLFKKFNYLSYIILKKLYKKISIFILIFIKYKKFFKIYFKLI